MTETSISLLSIICGIAGANGLGWLMPRFQFGMTSNSIAGVFGSIFLIKSLGRMGFDPTSIVDGGELNLLLLVINLLVSILGGVLGALVLKLLKDKMGDS
ncbi:hypothetical protein N6H18_11460 [Reichenbachiella agarivorans]|uniref:Fluoride ion transporter CrcB n=1 Tax=Reichenbachiella agarivorans TaxID=2979464 RepID=A0ABY6CKC1_9BACT|nr:hypothetical protein [Reichenbachiella agarivorans]UXP30967.1 hypothetical protein N6H18_11460 [Reichenbachiella agarivorans]